MKKIKVLVVDDSAFMRKMISDFLSQDSRIEVVGTARNGKDALIKMIEFYPDVITLDVEMPIMSGLEALKKIMSENPLPVVMLSSTTKEGAENTVLSMQYGAVDFIAKPSGAISLDLYKVKNEIISKVIFASQANLKGLKNFHQEIEIPISKQQLNVKNTTTLNLHKQTTNNTQKKIICIGTSTGGPRALQEVLTKLPKNINAPILIVQHMPPGFTKSLASRLDSLSEIHVKEAEDGEIIQRGTAYIAPGGYHLKVKKIGFAFAIKIDHSPIRNGHRPSVDVLFKSVSEMNQYKKLAVIMTGMGTDGAEGLKALKQSGELTAIAESKETSIIFGMPKAAIDTNVVDEIVNLNTIAETIVKYSEEQGV